MKKIALLMFVMSMGVCSFAVADAAQTKESVVVNAGSVRFLKNVPTLYYNGRVWSQQTQPLYIDEYNGTYLTNNKYVVYYHRMTEYAGRNVSGYEYLAEGYNGEIWFFNK